MLAFLPITAALYLTVPSGPVSWTFSATRLDDGEAQVELIAQVEEGWHIYATKLPSDQGPVATSIRIKPSRHYTTSGDLQEPEPVEEYDRNFDMIVRHHSGSMRFVVPIKTKLSGAVTIEGEVEYMVCNDSVCLPPVMVPFKLTLPAA